jgi:AraC-like DNA-binding protein
MQTVEFVRSYFDAWNHSDARGVAEHLAINGTYIDVPQDEQLSKEDLVTNLGDFFAREHHRYVLLGEILASKNSIAFQYKSSPIESMSKDTWFGAEFMTIKGDGAIKILDYYDPANTVNSATAATNRKSGLKYAKSGLNSIQMESYTKQLTELMITDKTYLEPGLTMPKLAELLNCSVNHLSQVLNSGFEMSFFDFLNAYRIEEAKILLRSGCITLKAILDVSFAVGFNSNSAFYAAFKKNTGQTPNQFRRANILESDQG